MLSGDGSGVAGGGTSPTAEGPKTLRDSVIGDGAIEDAAVADLVESVEAATRSLLHLDTSGLSNADRRALLVRIERVDRMLSRASYTWINQVVEQKGLDPLPGSAPHALAELLGVSVAQAGERLRRSARLGSTTAPSGEILQPAMPATARALADGAISAQHVSVVEKFVKKLPGWVDPATRENSERQLADLARVLPPESLTQAASRLSALIDEDGPCPKDPEQAARRRSFWIKDQDDDGMSEGGFVTDAETRALLEAVFAAMAKPGRFDPDAELSEEPVSKNPDSAVRTENSLGAARSAGDTTGSEPVIRDPRTVKQRQHDAFTEILRQFVRSGIAGSTNGVEAIAIITMTLADLEKETGLALTATGSTLPIRDAVRMAARSRPYLLIFDDDGRPLHLGRARRTASRDQRLALFGAERGCTFPGCTRPASWCQTHHITEWAHGGNTDIDSMTLACESHHPLVGPGESQWATSIAPAGHPFAGRTLWHPPAALDPTRTGRVNHFHHPDEMLLGDPPVDLAS